MSHFLLIHKDFCTSVSISGFQYFSIYFSVSIDKVGRQVNNKTQEKGVKYVQS